MPRFGKKRGLLDLLRIGNGGEDFNDEFVFENLWFGRASFVVASPDRAKDLLEDFMQRLEKRKAARAQVRQTVHVVWDLKEPVPDSVRSAFETLAPATGFSLFVSGQTRA
jgi:hypothetical protein